MTLLTDLYNYIKQQLELQEREIWIGSLSNTYNNVVVITQTGGIQDNTGTSNLRQPTIQILVRNNSYKEAYKISYDIHNLLHRLNNVTMGSSNIMHIHNLQEPQEVEIDKKERVVFSCNYHFYLR